MKKQFILLLLFPLMAIAEEPHITTELTSHDAYLGDPVGFTIRVLYEKGWVFEDIVYDDKAGDATILSQGWTETPSEDGQTINRHFNANIAWYDLGEKTLPPFAFKGTSPDGETQEFSSSEMNIKIAAMLEEDDQELAPSKGQIQMEATPLWPFILAGVLLLALIIWLIMRRLNKREQPKVVTPPKPLLPPFDEAYAAMESLTHSSLLKEGEYKEFYVRINLIIRRYYSRLYEITAEEMTSYEMEIWLEDKADLPGESRDLNRNFQELCDQVKYAKHDPDEAETKQVVNSAYRILEVHKPMQEVSNVPSS